MQFRFGLSALALASLTTPALAQQDGASSGLEEVVVTGSSIRGVTSPGSPVIALGREEMAATGLATSSDFARALPQVINLGADESRLGGAQDGAANATRISGINLRGIGNEATLLLINGRRLAPAGVIKALYDPNVIPSAAIERMEVVVDGASAIYGSDAVAGVVNIITRKDFNGAETMLRYGVADGTSQKVASQNFGFTWDSGSVFGAYEHYERDALAGHKRSYATQDLRARGGADQRSYFAAPGNIVVGAGTAATRYALPAGNGMSIDPDSLTAGTANRFDEGTFADLLPNQERDTFFLDARQRIGNAELWYQGWMSRRDFDERVAPASGTLRVPSTNPYFVAPTALGSPASVSVEYRFMAEDPDPRFSGFENAHQNALGVTFDVGDWQVEAYGNLSKNRGYQRRSPLTNSAALTNALNSLDPATALNVFGDGTFNRSNMPELLDIIIAYRDTYGTSEARDLGVKADGPLFELPGGDVRIAAGAERHDNEFSQELYATNVYATGEAQYRKIVNRRHNTALFAEMFVPIVSSSNSVTGIEDLTLSAAVRREEYSDFGETTNPKVGVVYKPVQSLTLRATYGTAFRAPSLVDTSEELHNIFISNMTDPLSPTGQTRGINHNGGRADLKPEEATVWSFGFDWRPSGALDGFAASATYYEVDYTDRIDVPSNQLSNPDVYAPFIIRRPPASDAAGNAAFDALVQTFMESRDLQSPVEAVSNIQVIVDGRRANLGTLLQKGLDIDLSYRFETSLGNWFTSLNVAKILDLTRATVRGMPEVDVLDTFGNPVDLRGRLTLGWRNGGWSANAFVNYVDGYTNTAVTPFTSVDSYTTVDASVSYEFGSGKLEGLSISLNGQDLFDEDPPVVINGSRSWDSQNVSPLGRFVSLVVTKKW
jgi:iron complex outermembrane receptor protein